MNPYRRERKQPELPSGPVDREAAYRASRRRLALGLSAFFLLCASVPAMARWLRAPKKVAVPVELLDFSPTFPLARAPLRPSVPLDPLLVADAPDHLALLEPGSEINALNVRPGEPLRVRFNRPMVPAVRVNKPARADEVLSFEPHVRGKLTWTSRNAASFEPDAKTFHATRMAKMTVASGLRSLSGESIDEAREISVVFDDGPRFAGEKHTRLFPGEPLEIYFAGEVDATRVAQQMLAYEIDGGRRALSFSVKAQKRDARGRTPLDVMFKEALEPGAHLALAISPILSRGGSGPRVVEAELAPRPKIEGFGCPTDATEAAQCQHQGAPGAIVDVDEALVLLSTASLTEPKADDIDIRPALPNKSVKIDGEKRLIVRGDWDPEQVYRVGVRLRDSDDRPLEKVAPLAVRSAGRPPVVEARSGHLTYEPDAKAKLGLRAIHIDRGVARMASVPEGKELEAALFPQRFVSDEHKDAWSKLDLPFLVPRARANRWGRGELSWNDKTSMAIVALLPNGEVPNGGEPAATFLQQTDLGLDVEVLAHGVFAWLTSIKTAKPMAGARVTLADGDGHDLTSGTTDERGLVWLPTTDDRLTRPTAVRATLGRDRAVMVLQPKTALGPRHVGVSPGEAPPAEDTWVATVFADRGIARPGETLHAKAIVRAPIAGQLQVPAVSKTTSALVSLWLFGPTGDAPIDEHHATLSSFGSIDASFPIPRGAEDGAYRIEARRDGTVLGVTSVRVGDYRTPPFRVDLSAPDRAVDDKDPLRIDVSAAYLFGAPAAGRAVSWSVFTEPADEPERWAEYAFAPEDASSRRGAMATGDLVLDDAGRAAIAPIVALEAPRRETASVEVTVRDPSGDTTTARKSIELFPATYEVGLQTDRRWVTIGEALEANTIVIDHAGEPVAGRKVEAAFIREGWQAYWEHTSSGTSASSEGEGESEEAEVEAPKPQQRKARARDVAHRCKLVSEREAVTCSFTPKRAGEYRVEVTTTDERGRKSIASHLIYVTAPDQRPDRDAPGTAITLTPTKSKLEVGETAEIAFESPFDDAQALFEVERDGVLFSEVRRVSAGGNVLRFNVTKDMVPNAFVALRLVKPRTGEPGVKLDLDAPDLRVGFAEITARPANAPLNVSIDVAERARAGQETAIDVDVLDASGNGVATEVALYAVDLGTLRVTNYATPDASSGLYPRRAPAFAWEDLRRSLVSRLEDQLSPSAGGDGATGLSARQRDEDRDHHDPTPLWLPHVVTDASGHASATIRLPLHPTQYRVMAVVTDAGARTGSAEKDLIATMPIVVRPALPAHAIEGDRFEAVAFVHNTEDVARDVEVTPMVEGYTREPIHLHLEAHADARVATVAEPSHEGDFTVRFEARSEDDIAFAEATIPIATSGHVEQSASVGSVVGERTIVLDLPASAGDVGLSIAAHPFVGFDASFDALATSNEAGVEATASRLLGVVAYAALDTGHRPESASPKEIHARADRAIERLVALQTGDGGFGAYSRRDASDPYFSAYALLALASARSAGFVVPVAVLTKAREHLHEVAQRTGASDQSPAGRDDLAFALRALSVAGEVDETMISSLFEQRDLLTPFGLAELSLAMGPSDRRRDALVIDAVQRTLDGRSLGGSPRWYDSSARTLGAVLEAACAGDSPDARASNVASRLLATRSSATASWWSSLETSHALAGLAAFAATTKSDSPIAPRVAIDGVVVAPTQHSRDVAWYALPSQRIAGTKHTLTIASKDAVWFSLASRWIVPASKDDEVARGERVALHRVLEDAAGKPLEPGAHVHLGDLIRVRLFVFSEEATPPHLRVHDPVSGGLEPVDARHETSPREALWSLLGMEESEDAVDARGHYASRSLDMIEARSFDLSGASFYVTESHGLREVTYGVRATSVGTFTLPPAEAMALYSPAFNARSALTSITVDP